MLILPPGHARAIASPRVMGGRERWFVRVAVAATALLVAAVIVSLSVGSSSPRKGCLDVTFASSMGAGEVRGCGAAARRVCADVGTTQGYTGELGRELADRCRVMHLPVGR